jgi:flagellar hook protein FlgE
MGIGNIADTGMQAAMANMEVISNNIANANSYGFKRSFINFADIYPSANGSAGNQVGLGVDIVGVSQNFISTGYESTGGSLDLSIQKNGFFALKDPTSGQTSFTRNGQFVQGNDGYIYSIFGPRLQGYPAINGTVPSGGTPTDLQLANLSMPAKASTSATINVNLNSSDTKIPSTPFNPTDPTTYNFDTAGVIFDSLGNSHNLQLFYVKTSTPNNWQVNVLVDGQTVSAGGTMVFSDTGAFLSETGLDTLSYTPTNGAAAMSFSVTASGSTQVANPYNEIGAAITNGYIAGSFTGQITVDNSGNVNMSYSNGKQQVAGQIAIANFQSLQGLTDIGSMQWISSTQSGAPVFSQSNATNNINVGKLEQSNVDLTTEMVNLINAQHAFQANAQVEQVYNEVMQTVIQL